MLAKDTREKQDSNEMKTSDKSNMMISKKNEKSTLPLWLRLARACQVGSAIRVKTVP